MILLPDADSPLQMSSIYPENRLQRIGDSNHIYQNLKLPDNDTSITGETLKSWPLPANSDTTPPQLVDTPVLEIPTITNQTEKDLSIIDETICQVENPNINNDSNGKNNNIPPESNEPQRGFLPVLKNRNFLALWSGQVFSQLADKIYLVLMIAIIASRFQAENQPISGWVSAIMVAFTIPAMLFGSLAGVFVDRWSKKGVLVFTNILRGGLVLGIPALLWLVKNITPVAGLPVGFYILLVITFLVSTLTQFFAPAEQSAIPLVVEKRQLLAANSLYTTTMMASVIIGFAVGEPLLAASDAIVSKISGGWEIGRELIVGGSYAIAGIILILLKTKEKPTPADYEPPHVWEDIRDGLRFLKNHAHVRSAMIQLVILFSIFAALAVLAVRLAELIPTMKASQFGFLLAAGGIGMAIGAAITGSSFGHRFHHNQLSLYGSLGMGASLAGLSIFAKQLWPALLLITLLGVFAAIVGVPMQTTIQAETPEDMRGKVFGLQNNGINIALSLPLALAGVAETFLGLRVVFLGLSAIAIAGAILSWYISRIETKNSTITNNG